MKSFTTKYKHVAPDDFIALTVPIAMYCLGKSDIVEVLVMWFWIIACASFSFGVIGLNAGHHHPESSHEGDELWQVSNFKSKNPDVIT